jgi:dTDP-4-amino-4,6-dideoxygalactose transaminase
MEVVQSKLQQASIFPRRYFYPSLNQLPYLNGESCPISEDISDKILCLPNYVGLSADDLNLICEIINANA